MSHILCKHSAFLQEHLLLVRQKAGTAPCTQGDLSMCLPDEKNMTGFRARDPPVLHIFPVLTGVGFTPLPLRVTQIGGPGAA